MKMNKLVMLITIFMLIINSHAAFGKNYYIKKADDGENENITYSEESWNVTSTSGTLTNLINNADNGDTFYIAQGTYKLTKTINLKSGVKLYGGYKGDSVNERDFSQYNTTLDGGGTFTVIKYDNASDSVLDGFTIINGKSSHSGGGMYISNAGVTIANCVFSKNNASQRGGGLYISGTNTVKIQNCVFSENSASYEGGGICSYGDKSGTLNVIIEKCTFDKNFIDSAQYNVKAYKGGAALCNVSYNAGAVVSTNVTNCTFSGNYLKVNAMTNPSQHFGVAICNYSAVPNGKTELNIKYCTIIDSETPPNAGMGAVILNGGFNQLANKNLCTFSISDSLLWRNTDNDKMCFFLDYDKALFSLENCAAPEGKTIYHYNSNNPVDNSMLRLGAYILESDSMDNNSITHTVYNINRNPVLLTLKDKGKNSVTDDQLGKNRDNSPDIGAVELDNSAEKVLNAFEIKITPADTLYDFSINGTLQEDKAFRVSFDTAGILTLKASITGLYNDNTSEDFDSDKCSLNWSLDGRWNYINDNVTIESQDKGRTALISIPASKMVFGQKVDVTLKAEKSGVSKTQQFSFWLNVVNVPPELQDVQNMTLTAGQAINDTHIKALKGASLVWEFENLPEGLSFTVSGEGTFTNQIITLSGTPEESTGGKVFSCTIKASNSAGNASKTFTISVNNEAPELSQKNITIKALKGQAVNNTVINAVKGTNIIWSSSGNLPEGIIFNADTHTISGTPALGTTGIYSWCGGGVQQSSQITIHK